VDIVTVEYATTWRHGLVEEGVAAVRWQKTEGLDPIVDLKSSWRAGFLFTDLTTLGMRPNEPVMTPAFVGVEQALGWMYVVERGRRMNALLCRHLSRRLPQVMLIAGNYLNASSPCGTRWQQFGAALDRFADNHVIVDQIIDAAHRAFRTIQPPPRYTDSPAHAA